MSVTKLYIGDEENIALKKQSYINDAQYTVLNADDSAYDFDQDGGIASLNFKVFDRRDGNELIHSTSNGSASPLVRSTNVITHAESWSDFDDNGDLKAGAHYYYQLYWVTVTDSKQIDLSFGRLEIE